MWRLPKLFLASVKFLQTKNVDSVINLPPSVKRCVWELHGIVNGRFALDRYPWTMIPGHNFGRHSGLSGEGGARGLANGGTISFLVD